MGENHSLKKADEWRRLAAILPFVLWACWRDDNDELPEQSPIGIPSNAKHSPHFTRNPKKIFHAALLLSVGCNVLASQSITKDAAEQGQGYIQQFCRLCLSLGVPMVPNHHMAMHYARLISLYGPVYAWWLFAFERFNGLLESVNTNGHANGVMELTLARNWLMRQRIYELVCYLLYFLLL